jgi:hypothetical protein
MAPIHNLVFVSVEIPQREDSPAVDWLRSFFNIAVFRIALML